MITSDVNQYLTETAGVTICASSACGGTAKSSVENAVTALLVDSPLMADTAREALPLLAEKPSLDLYDTISAHDLA